MLPVLCFKNSRDIHVSADGGEIGERAGMLAPIHIMERPSARSERVTHSTEGW
jgi:hypothetical protein